MALTSVDPDPNPGEAGYYDWHERVAESHNQLAGNSSNASADDLAGYDANGDLKVVDGDTYQRRQVVSIEEFDSFNGDGGNNTQAIVDAIAHLDPANGGTGGAVWLGRLHSDVDAQITVPMGVRLAGAGMGNDTYDIDGTAAPTRLRAVASIFSVLRLENWREQIRDFLVDGNSQATHCIHYFRFGRAVAWQVRCVNAVEDGHFPDPETGDQAPDSTSGDNNFLTFAKCEGRNNGRDGFGMGPSQNRAMQYSYWECDGSKNGRYGALIGRYQPSVKGGHYSFNTDEGIQVGAVVDAIDVNAISAYIEYPHLEGNKNGNDDEGIAFGGGTAHPHTVLLREAGQHANGAGLPVPGAVQEVRTRDAGVRTTWTELYSGRELSFRPRESTPWVDLDTGSAGLIVNGDPLAPSLHHSGYYLSPQPVDKANKALINERLMAAPMQVADISRTISELAVRVTSAGQTDSVIRLGIYADDGTGQPGALLVDAGTVAGDATGIQPITGLTQAVSNEWVWLAGVAQNAGTTAPSATCHAVQPVGMGATSPSRLLEFDRGIGWAITSGVSGALPDPFGDPTTQEQMPVIVAKID